MNSEYIKARDAAADAHADEKYDQYNGNKLSFAWVERRVSFEAGAEWALAHSAQRQTSISDESPDMPWWTVPAIMFGGVSIVAAFIGALYGFYLFIRMH